MSRVVLLAWALSSLALGRPVLAAPADPASARAELEAGLDAYAREQFAVAASHFERAYQLDPSPQSLYAWAQAARSSGDCEQAVALYRRFLDGGATGDSRTAAEQNEARCREQLARAQPAAPTVPPPLPVSDPSPPREPAIAPPSVPARRDRVAPALLGVGAIVSAAGVVVLGLGGGEQRQQSRTRDYDRFHALDARIDHFYIAGGVSLGVGAVLLAVGAARLAGARKRARSLAVWPTWIPGGTAMLMLRMHPRLPSRR